jgi:hypothetical protein
MVEEERLHCYIFDKRVRENDWCEEYQNEGRFIDGDDDFLDGDDEWEDFYGETESKRLPEEGSRRN